MSRNKDTKSPRVKRVKIEGDVERLRAEGNLCRALELATHLNDRGSTTAYLYQLVNLEHMLATIDKDDSTCHSHQHPQCTVETTTPNAATRQNRLSEAETLLQGLYSHLPTDGSHRYALQGKILQGKLLYLQGRYQEAWQLLESLNLNEQLIDPQACSLTKLLAEAFAIMGLSLEEWQRSQTVAQPATSGKGKTESQPQATINESNTARVIENFELAGDLCIFHMQELEKSAGQLSSAMSGVGSSLNLLAPGMPKVVETAIQRSPIMHIQCGALNQAVDRFRQLLNYTETNSTQTIRQTLTRQFAELLLRGICSGNYHRYVVEGDRNHSTHSSQGQRTPKQCRPSSYPTERFIPEDHVQEAVLMLLISEFIANRSAILNRSPELAEARIRTFHNTTAVYDLLAIALVRKGCFHFLAGMLEHSLKFSYNEFHIWMQFALSLISAGKYHRAYLVLQECVRIEPQHIGCHIHAAVLCYQHLNLVVEGVEWSENLLKLLSPASENEGNTQNGGGSTFRLFPSFIESRDTVESGASGMATGGWGVLTGADFGTALRGRAHLLCGWGKSLLTKQCRLMERKRELQAEALAHFTNATKFDPQDHLTWYHLALERACQRNIDGAKQAIQQALRLCPSHSHSLHLLALLHTSSGDWNKAGMILDAAMMDHPRHMGLLLSKAKVEAVLHGNKKALACYKKLLEVWRDSFGSDYDAGAFLERLRQQNLSPVGTLNAASGNMMLNTIMNNSVTSTMATGFLDISDRASSVSGGNAKMYVNCGVGCVDWSRLEQRASSWLATVPSAPLGGSEMGGMLEGTTLPGGTSLHPTGLNTQITQDTWSASGYGRGPMAWLTKILLDLAALYLDMNSLNEALNCIEEAAAAAQMCPAIVFMRGRYLEQVQMFPEAKKLFEGVLTLCPEHVEVRQRLARILLDMGHIELAEKNLRDAIAVDASSCISWQYLGETLQLMSQREAAKHCLMVALDLECTQPLVDFQELPRGIGTLCA